MRGITIIFGNEIFHTGDDLDLVQEKKEIGKPDIQTYTAQVPGRNGLLNLTKALTGKVAYYNRPLSFQYFGTGEREHLLEIDTFITRLHGQTIQIVDDDFPNHYFEGEVSVDTELHGNYITITLDVDAQPFRLRREKTVTSRALNGTTLVYLDNESIEVVPTITVTAETTITFNGSTVSISAGTYTIDNFELHRGVNILEVTGTGRITFEYREGAI